MRINLVIKNESDLNLEIILKVTFAVGLFIYLKKNGEEINATLIKVLCIEAVEINSG